MLDHRDVEVTMDRVPLGVAVVGLGYWGPNLLRVLAEDDGIEIRWICDREPERLTRFGRRHPGARQTTEFHGSSTTPRSRP